MWTGHKIVTLKTFSTFLGPLPDMLYWIINEVSLSIVVNINLFDTQNYSTFPLYFHVSIDQRF